VRTVDPPGRMRCRYGVPQLRDAPASRAVDTGSCLRGLFALDILTLMVASLLTNQPEVRAFAKMLKPDPLANGIEPEERLIVCGISWRNYLALDKALGDDRPGPRFYYLDGDLELMTTSFEHERIKEWIGSLLEVYFEEAGVEIMPRGQATLRKAMKQAGAEPDKSWCIGDEKRFPDLVIEVALTSGGVNKLEIYRRFKVPEVWFWRKGKIEIFALAGTGDYNQVSRSQLLPDLDIALLERCVAIRSWQKARKTFRAALAAPKRQS